MVTILKLQKRYVSIQDEVKLQILGTLSKNKLSSIFKLFAANSTAVNLINSRCSQEAYVYPVSH